MNFQIFVGHDLFPGGSPGEEPYIRSLQDYYPNLAIKYYVKVTMGRNRNIWLTLYRRGPDGDFQDSDLELINCMCEILTSSYNAFEFHHSNIEMLGAINNAFDYFGGGIVTFDRNHGSMSFMGLANDIIHSITGCVRKTEALDTLLKQTGTKNGNVVSAIYRDYKCYLEEPHALNDRGYILFFPHAQSSNDIDSIPDFEILTSREKEVAICLASGLSYKDISEDLYISISTVRNHVTNIYRKLNINNQRQLISLYFGKAENRAKHE